MKHQLRQYQLDGIEQIRQAIREGHKRIVLQLPTGGGKTAIAAEIFRSAYQKGKKAYFICDRIELIDQAAARFSAEEIHFGVCQADHELTDRTQPIQIASIMTMARRKTLPGDLYCIDEGHVLYKAHIKLMQDNPDAIFLSLSATPWARGLGKYFSKLIIVSTTQKLIDDGFLVPMEVYGPSQPDLSKVKIVAGEYEESGLAEATNKPKLVGDIVETWLKLAAGRQTFCFAVNIAHSLAIVEAFNRAGVSARHVDCYAKPLDREQAFSDLRNGQLQILSSVDLTTRGVDYPAASCAILARPTKSRMVFVQQIGRVLRISPGKENSILLDHAGNHERHGFVTDPTPTELDDGKKKEKKPQNKKAEEKLTKPCPSCHFLKISHKCPKCGFAPTMQAKDIETQDGQLTLIKGKDKAKTEYTSLEKAKLFGELKYIAKERNWSDGRLANVFRELTGVWPNKYHNEYPRPPENKTLALVKYLDIRYIKSKQKQDTYV